MAKRTIRRADRKVVEYRWRMGFGKFVALLGVIIVLWTAGWLAVCHIVFG